MKRYIARRVVFGILVLLLVSVGTFTVVRLAPGGPGVLVSPDLPATEVARIRHEMGLDEPLYVQYWAWFSRSIRGDLGTSFVNGRPVLDLVIERLPATLILAGAAFLIALVFGMSFGIASALRPRSALDHLLTGVSFIGLSTPPFWLGIVLILVFSVSLRLLPSSGMQTLGVRNSPVDLFVHLIMPALVLGLISTAAISRYTRVAMISVLKEDYVRTARSKGLRERTVLFRHAMRNALIPVATILGTTFTALIGGAPVTESVFGWPGLGQLAVQAARFNDYTLIMAITLFVSLIVVITNLVIDLLYMYIDPRINLVGG
jgi:peptide/nickel transport system permease protein